MRLPVLILAAVLAGEFGHAGDTNSALKAKAESGDPAAQTQLADRYYQGNGGELNPDIAVSWWKKAARQNYVPAMLALGRAYYNGKIGGAGVDENFAQAWMWFQLAAQAGDSSGAENAKRAESELGRVRLNDARLRLGDALVVGDGIPTDIKFAIQIYTAAAQDSWGRAQLRLLDLYLTGEHMPRDLAAAGALCPLMEKRTGELQYCQARVERAAAVPDWKKIVSYYTAAVASSEPQSMVELGDLYAEGMHVQRDNVTAYMLYSRAGDASGLNRQKMRAVAERISLPELIEALGKADVKSFFLLKRLAANYYAGEIAPSDLPTIGKICPMLNRDPLRSEAEYCYARVERAALAPDWKNVVKHYLAATQLSDPRAASELADLYAEGIHVKRDDLRAVVLYALAINALKTSPMSNDQRELLKSRLTEKMGLLTDHMSPQTLESAKRALQDPRQILR